MKTVRYTYTNDIPLTHDVDVVVAGGGPGGIGAAVMAARAGARTLLVERYSCLGGMASVGEVHPFMDNHVNGKPLDGPVYTDWIEAMKKYAPAAGSDRFISKDIAAIAAEDLVLEAGCAILYHHVLADALTEQGAISRITLLSKSGFTAVRAKIYVDCTGDADLAARAGCEYEQGGPTGYCQPMTLCFKLSHVDKTRQPDGREINRLYDEARKRGEIQCPRENILKFNWFDDDVVHFNTTRVIRKNGISGAELSEAEIEARAQLRQLLAFFRNHVPGYENCRIHSIANHIGVRETRRVRGLAYLTRADFEAARKFPDAITRVNYPVDIHNPDGSGTELVHLPKGEWYEIPYGCIVAKDTNNLLIGGRPVSVDHAVHSSMRVMPPACTIGQAAGLAAALAAQRKCMPCELDGREIRKILVENGAPL